MPSFAQSNKTIGAISWQSLRNTQKSTNKKLSGFRKLNSEEVQEEYDEERKGIARSWNYFDQHEE